MDNKTATDLLDRMPLERSNYEFRNFNLEMFGSFPRQLRSVLLERETLSNQIAEIEAEIELIKLTPKSDNARIAALESQRNLAKVNQMTRKLNGLKQNLAQVNDWLDSQDPEAMKEAAAKFEDHEGEYWTDVLGRAGAIDLLAIGRTRPDTMGKLSQLPLADYKKTVTIISQLANFLKDTTEQAEATLYPAQDQIASGTTQE
jgi:hypothetical protein